MALNTIHFISKDEITKGLKSQEAQGPKYQKWCFRPRFCTCKTILGRGQPGLTRWIMNQATGAVSITRPFDQQSSMTYQTYRCPRKSKGLKSQEAHGWQAVDHNSGSSISRLTVQDGGVWLLMYNLLSPKCLHWLPPRNLLTDAYNKTKPCGIATESKQNT